MSKNIKDASCIINLFFSCVLLKVSSHLLICVSIRLNMFAQNLDFILDAAISDTLQTPAPSSKSTPSITSTDNFTSTMATNFITKHLIGRLECSVDANIPTTNLPTQIGILYKKGHHPPTG